MSVAVRYDETITLPRAVKFPIELLPPEDFDPEHIDTWPQVVGRLEYVDGRLLYMLPSGDLQQDTTTDVVIILGGWVRAHTGFVLGTNEAGMRIAGATRAADAAVWLRSNVGDYSGGLRRTPPLLAVEVAGPNEGKTEELLRSKAAWYLGVGVSVVWLVFPETREVIVVSRGGESRHSGNDTLPPHSELSDLRPVAADFFHQIDAQG